MSFGMEEGRALYANREEEPSDWGDWADENGALLMDEIDRLRGENRRLCENFNILAKSHNQVIAWANAPETPGVVQLEDPGP